MTNPSILLKDGSEIPEGIMDAFISTMCALHDFKNKKNSKATYVNILGLDESIKKSKDLCASAISEIKNIKSGEIDLLIELAKYICYREK